MKISMCTFCYPVDITFENEMVITYKPYISNGFGLESL